MSIKRRRTRIAAGIREALARGRVDASNLAAAAGLNAGSFRMAIREQSAGTYQLEEWLPAIIEALEAKARELDSQAAKLRKLL